jgi:hypothetical protein
MRASPRSLLPPPASIGAVRRVEEAPKTALTSGGESPGGISVMSPPPSPRQVCGSREGGERMILCDECDDGSSPTRAPTLSTSNAPTLSTSNAPTLSTSNAPTLVTHGAECEL